MAKKINDRVFFTQSAETLAQALVGKILCRRDGEGEDEFIIRARIKTTEAYRHTDDVTDANRSSAPNAQLLEGGHLHFGNQNNPNYMRIDVVAGQAGQAESVLIAGLDPYGDGPTIAVHAMGIEAGDPVDGLDLLAEGSIIWIEDDGAEAVLDAPAPRRNLSESSEVKDDALRFTAKSFSWQ